MWFLSQWHPIGRPRRRWENSIKMGIQELGERAWTGLTWIRKGISGEHGNTMRGNFLTRWRNISSRKLLQGVSELISYFVSQSHTQSAIYLDTSVLVCLMNFLLWFVILRAGQLVSQAAYSDSWLVKLLLSNTARVSQRRMILVQLLCQHVVSSTPPTGQWSPKYHIFRVSRYTYRISLPYFISLSTS